MRVNFGSGFYVPFKGNKDSGFLVQELHRGVI